MQHLTSQSRKGGQDTSESPAHFQNCSRSLSVQSSCSWHFVSHPHICVKSTQAAVHVWNEMLVDAGRAKAPGQDRTAEKDVDTHTDTNVTYQHHNNRKTTNSPFFFCQSPRAWASHPALPSIIITPTSPAKPLFSAPFKWQVDGARYPATASQPTG